MQTLSCIFLVTNASLFEEKVYSLMSQPGSKHFKELSRQIPDSNISVYRMRVLKFQEEYSRKVLLFQIVFIPKISDLKDNDESEKIHSLKNVIKLPTNLNCFEILIQISFRILKYLTFRISLSLFPFFCLLSMYLSFLNDPIRVLISLTISAMCSFLSS